MSDDDALRAYQEKVERDALLGRAQICALFKTSEMYGLLDLMMAAIEHEAMMALENCNAADKDEVFALTIRWQERKRFRRHLLDEIDSNIADAQQLIEAEGLDLDEWKIRSTLEHG